MIAKVERMNMRQENYEGSQENKSMLENISEEFQTPLVQLKEMRDAHKDVSLPEILKVKQRINARIGDFDIDCVSDEKT
jgi:hypothetical protein